MYWFCALLLDPRQLPFPEASWCDKNSIIIFQHCLRGFTLWCTETPDEFDSNTFALISFIVECHGASGIRQQRRNGFSASARQQYAVNGFFAAIDDAWLVIHRLSHGLSPIEVRIGERGKTANGILCKRSQICL